MTGRRLSGLVVRTRSGFVDVETAEGLLRCKLRGRLKKDRRRSDLCVVGDRVDVTPLEGGGGVVEGVEPRRTRFSRRHPGPGGKWREDVIVANLDQVVCVFSFDRPAFNPRLLDRFLVVAEHNRVDAVIVANKVDLAERDDTREYLRIYEQIGYPVLYTSATADTGLVALERHLQGRLSAFAGPSGVGKSRLLNALEPGLQLEVGEVSEAVAKGRHTTRVATLHRLSSGGYVCDTPGIRELGTWRLPPQELAACFAEFRPYLADCAFGDCLHVEEPDCAVRAARDAGDITEARYDSYLRILEDEQRPGS